MIYTLLILVLVGVAVGASIRRNGIEFSEPADLPDDPDER